MFPFFDSIKGISYSKHMTKNPEDFFPEDERPLECSECKKPIAVRYTEIVGDSITHTIMCVDCPQLQRRLHGIPASTIAGEQKLAAGLCCGNCGTTLDAVRMGNPVGCNECYEVFEDILLSEMTAAHKIPPRITPTKKTSPIHIGRSPGEIKEISSTLRLVALNEALNETLRKEDYEQAAWLRDQIKALTDETKEKDEPK